MKRTSLAVALLVAARALAVGQVEKWKIGLLMAFVEPMGPVPLGPDGRLRFAQDPEDFGCRRSLPAWSYAKIPTQGISVSPTSDDIGKVRKAYDLGSATEEKRFEIGHLGALMLDTINSKVQAMKAAVKKIATRYQTSACRWMVPHGAGA